MLAASKTVAPPTTIPTKPWDATFRCSGGTIRVPDRVPKMVPTAIDHTYADPAAPPKCCQPTLTITTPKIKPRAAAGIATTQRTTLHAIKMASFDLVPISAGFHVSRAWASEHLLLPAVIEVRGVSIELSVPLLPDPRYLHRPTDQLVGEPHRGDFRTDAGLGHPGLAGNLLAEPESQPTATPTAARPSSTKPTSTTGRI